MLKEFIKKWGLETPDDLDRQHDAIAARRCLSELNKMGVFPSMQDFRNERCANPFFFLADILIVTREERLEAGRKRYLALTPEQQEILDFHPDRGGWFMGTHRLPGVDF